MPSHPDHPGTYRARADAPWLALRRLALPWFMLPWLVLIVGLACAVGVACHEHHTTPAWAGVGSAVEPELAEWTKGDRDEAAVPVPPPPFSKGIFPCTSCHEDADDYDPTPRQLDEHDTIHLRHGPREGWCFDCHVETDRDRLKVPGGRTVPFEQSYLLCGQCHGPELRSWRAGVHGKRTGSWSGAKEYKLCVHCHNPHTPRFAPLEPMPAPRRPGDIHIHALDEVSP